MTIHASRNDLLSLYHLLDENENFDAHWKEGSTPIDSLCISIMIGDLEIETHWEPGSDLQENFTLGSVFLERWN